MYLLGNNMIDGRKSGASSRDCNAFVLLLFLVVLCYGGTLNAEWHLDDHHVIINNTHLHINNLGPESLIRSFFAHPDQQSNLDKKFYRPFSCLTLAINWYLGKTRVVGYHIVNIFVHILTAFFLFLTVYKILKLPNMRDKYRGNEHFIALLTTTLWAINPIQTQAVTYVVQRMASMATLFYVLSLLFYIEGRTVNSHLQRKFFFFSCLLSFLLGLASKENVMTLPIALVLVETIFFQDLSQAKTKKVLLWVTVGGVILFIVIGSLLFMDSNPISAILSGYKNRYFTPAQRLMTEPRILVYYLSQIFYPVPTRLSIEHDVLISTSLLNPWTTLPSIGLILGLIGFGVWQIRKMPILSFAILFFFLNHLIESSIISLELIFEHRNYLPSLFVFLPVSIGIKRLLDYYRDKKNPLFGTLVTFVILLLVGFGSGTYIRNMAWSTERSLWEDAVKKAPGMMRPVHNLAWTHARAGHYDKAMELYEKSLVLEGHSIYHRLVTLNSMGNIQLSRGNYEKAAELWKEALDIYPKHAELHYGLALTLTKLRDWEEALANIEKSISIRPRRHDYFNLKGEILLNQGRPKEALSYFRKALKLKPGYRKAIVNTGISLSLMEEYERAEWFLKSVVSTDPRHVSALLWLIEINLRTNDKEDTDRYVDRLFALVQVTGLIPVLKDLLDENIMVAASQDLLVREIARKLRGKSMKIAELVGG
jgi:tetratricopeptide (TPR) repeat protein